MDWLRQRHAVRARAVGGGLAGLGPTNARLPSRPNTITTGHREAVELVAFKNPVVVRPSAEYNGSSVDDASSFHPDRNAVALSSYASASAPAPVTSNTSWPLQLDD